MIPLPAHGSPWATAPEPALAGALLLPTLLYVLAVTRLRWRGRRWQGARTVAFLAGNAAVAVALLPPLAGLADLDLRAHMLQHLLLGMLGPIGLVLGAPVTLALRTVPVRAARAAVRLLQSRPARFLSHPVPALVLNVGGMAVLYLTPLYGAMASRPVLHALVHLHFLAAGFLFTWAIVGVDRVGPHRPGPWTRLGALFAGMAAHGTLAKAMYAWGWPRDAGHGLEEIERAAQIMYYGGDASEVLLLIALFGSWRSFPAAAGSPAVSGAALRDTTR